MIPEKGPNQFPIHAKNLKAKNNIARADSASRSLKMGKLFSQELNGNRQPQANDITTINLSRSLKKL